VKPISGLELCRHLEKAGWQLRRIKRSHHIFSKPGETRIITVPVHGSHQIKPGLAARIARDAKIAW
jgi:predicted RNA binding protein YcfA (HicA-like mRNA interferase family)